MEFTVLVGGEAGQGMFSVELELTELLSKLHYHLFATKNYMSRIRGGHNFHMIRIAETPVHALSGEPWDMIIALDPETEGYHKQDLSASGIFLPPSQIKEMEGIARERFGGVTAVNTMLVGLILSTIGCPQEKFSGITDISSNPAHLSAGFEFAHRWGLAGRYRLTPKAQAHCKFDGNQALALGALLGGCQFMAGYPMTPATSIMQYISTVALDHPVHFEQAEDEISAVNMALGASYAGLRSLVATSGGGFALMQEGISLAGMTETPVVVIVAQRPGPATGLPTRTEQGDLNFVLHAGHGEFPRAIYAPGTLHEAMVLARKSFHVADGCQTPVFILTDQYFADSVQMMFEDIPLEITRRDYGSFDASYRRYRLTDSGLSPLACPGAGDGLVRVDSDEHDEEGKITEDLSLRARMVEKRLRKFDFLRKETVMPSFTGNEASDVIVINWGSNKMIVEEAVRRLIGEGVSAGALHFSQVYPLTQEMAAPWNLKGKRLLSVENNATGQFAALLKRELGLTVDHQILKYNGECFTVRELSQTLRKHLP